MTRRRAACLLACLALATACHDQASGAQRAIRVVGSSTVFPLTAAVAERFARLRPDGPAPVIESTGTGGGMRLFCAGVGAAFPDIADASRRMEAAEYRRCAANGAGALMEVEIGRDGVAFVRGPDGPDLPLTPALLYRALAAAPGGRANTARTWRDLDPRLPDTPIRLYGPPATSGTRDVLVAQILRQGCPAGERDCSRLREDGAYIDAGEHDALIVQRLRADPQAIGVLGYGFLRANAGAVSGLALDGVRPTYAAIASGSYPGARPLYLYVKLAHLAAVPGLRDLLRFYVASWGPDGELVRRGLIAAPAAVRARSATIVAREIPLDPATLR